MPPDNASRVYKRLQDAQALTRLVSDDGPMAMRFTDDGRAELLRRDEVVGVLNDPAIADFLVKAAPLLRTLAETLMTIYAKHRTDGGDCVACGQLAPCSTRQIAESRLLTRGGQL